MYKNLHVGRLLYVQEPTYIRIYNLYVCIYVYHMYVYRCIHKYIIMYIYVGRCKKTTGMYCTSHHGPFEKNVEQRIKLCT